MDEVEKIVNYLIMYNRNIPLNSLYHGKMGVMVALYIYAVRKQNCDIKEWAWRGLENVLENVYENLPVGLENGFAGIGYGITLLKKEAGLDCNLNEVLFDIDHKIMERAPRRVLDISLRTGARGIWSYLKFRQETEPMLLSVDNVYRKELKTVLEHYGINTETIRSDEVFLDLKHPTWGRSEYIGKDVGISEGVAYYLLKELNLIKGL